MYCSGIGGLFLLYRGLFLTSYEAYMNANGGTANCGDCFKVAFRWEAGICLATGLVCGAALWYLDGKQQPPRKASPP